MKVHWLLFLPALSTAQVTGDLLAEVSDAARLPIREAAVTIAALETGYQRTIRSDVNGTALFRLLQPGPYVVKASMAGFSDFEALVSVSLGTTTTFPIALAVQASEQSITVSAAGQEINTSDAQLSMSTEAARVERLPVGTVRGPLALGGGAVLSLAFNIPGVSPNLQRSSASNPGTFYVNGNRGRSNNITLDNATVTDVVAAGAMGLQTVPIDAIREFNIITTNLNAEFGRNSGAQVQIVTKSGSNKLHGSLFNYFRNSAMNTRDFFDRTGTTPPLRSNDFGGAGGGALKRDRVFWFGHVQKIVTRGFSNTRVASVPTPEQAAAAPDPTAQQLLRQLQVPTSPTGTIANASPQTADFLGFSGRLDVNFSVQDRLFVRYGFADYTFRDPLRTFLGSELPTSGTSIANVPHNATIAHTRTFGSSTVNHFVAAFGRSDPTFPPLYPLGGPFVQFLDGTSAFGWNNGVTSTRLQNTFQYLDTLAGNRGPHHWKLGASLSRTQSNSFLEANLRGVFTFASLNEFLSGRPSEYTQRFGNSSRGFRQWTQEYFLQDDYRLRRDLTVNLGLRVEVNGEVSEVNGLISNLNLDRRQPVGGAGEGPLGSFDVGLNAYRGTVNWAPRLGFAWNPASGSLVLRGGYGLVYDYIPLSNAYLFLRSFPPLMYEFKLTGTQLTGNNSFGNLAAGTSDFQRRGAAAVGGFPPEVLNFGSLTAIDRELGNPQVHQWNLTLEHRLSGDVAVRASYVGSRSTHLARQRPLNLIAPDQFTRPSTLQEELQLASSGELARINRGLSPGPEAFSNRIDRRFGAVNYLESTGNGSYHSLQLLASRRFAGGYGLSAAYTFSKSIDDVSESGFLNDSPSAQDPFNHRNNRALSAFDVPHRFTLTWNLQPDYARRIPNRIVRAVLGDWGLDGIFQVQSGLPVTILAGPKFGITDPTLLGGAGGQHADWTANGSFAFEPDPGSGAANPSKVAASGLRQPLAGHLGNLGRSTHRINPLAQFDVTVSKRFVLTERAMLTLHFQTYNVFNHPVFALGANGRGRMLGQSTTFGYYNQTDSDPRNVQIVARIVW